MHTLHILHTQERPDADQYLVEPWTDNYPYKIPESFPSSYDFGSAMHYSAKSGLKAKDSRYDATMGQRVMVPFSDWKILNLHWNCSESCRPLPCKNDGFPHPRNCSKCFCNDFYTGTLCDTPKKTVSLQSSTTINVTLFTPKSEYNKYPGWRPKDPSRYMHYTPTIIKAPAGRKIRVTILEYSDINRLSSVCEGSALEIVDGSLSLVGIRYCRENSPQGKTFVSKSNVVGLKASSIFSWPLSAKVKFDVV